MASYSNPDIWVKTVIKGLTPNGSLSSGLEFKFLNCTIEVDTSVYGAHAICPGCGSGKTTNIRNLIEKVWNEGVLYSAFTKKECDEMYHFCKSLVGSVKRDPVTGKDVTLKLDDIIVIHSGYTSEGVDNNSWRSNPAILADKRIIICTHYKLLNEPFHLFLNSNFNPTSAYVEGLIRSSVKGTGSSRLPRQWILIDENMESNPNNTSIEAEFILSLGLEYRWLSMSEKAGMISVNWSKSVNPSVNLGDSIRVLPTPYLGEFEEYFRDLVDSVRRYHHILRPENNEIDRIKNSYTIETVFHDYNEIVRKLKSNPHPNDSVNISYGFSNLVCPGMRCHVLLFDGTSDITMSNSKVFKLETSTEKYSSPVTIKRFRFGVPRKLTNRVIGDMDPDTWIRTTLDNLAIKLFEIISKHHKTLIFTWKNFKGENDEINDDFSDEVGKVELGKKSKIVINPKLDIPGYLKVKLNEMGLLHGVEYSIEYYGSGRDKAINDYKDYDTVVLAGSYTVPNSTIDDFNRMFKCNIGPVEYYSNRVVQAICRTRIRNHDGKDISVYFSSDWSGDIVKYVDIYLNSGHTSYVEPKVEDYYQELRSMGITPKKAEKMNMICKLDAEIMRSIREHVDYSVSFRLNEVFDACPMMLKESKRYDCLFKTFDKFGIHISII